MCSKPSLVEKNDYRVNEETRNGDTRKTQIVFAISMEKLHTRIRLQLATQKPFRELLNVKLFKR